MKKVLALILALLMMMTVFVGCGNDAELDDTMVEDDVISEDVDAESEKESYVRIDAFCDKDYNFYELTMTEYGEKVTNNGIDVGNSFVEGETVKELLERSEYTDVAFAKEYDGFMGWALYKMGEEGMEPYGEDILYTTEGMFEYVVPAQGICFVAKWENTPDDMYESMGY